MNNKEEDDDDDNYVDTIDDDPIKDISQELVQCPACLRRMRQEVFSKHPNVCRESPAKKRNIRVFDMSQYRAIRSGDKVIPVRKVSPYNENKSNNMNNNNIRPSQTRSTKRTRRPDDTVVPPIINNFCCPNCKRTFCEKAYDRHVKFCSSKSKQLQQPPSEETLLARLKLDRRIKFGSNRPSTTVATLSNTSPAIITSTPPSISTPITEKQPIQQKPSLPTEKFCFLSMRKTSADSLARCPWCSKPYMPNCIHYCRNAKELFSIQSK